MHRRAFALPALLVVAALVLGACGAGSAPPITDPKEIITKSVEAIQKAKTVHLEVTVEGTLTADLIGSGQTSEMSLAGTSLTADLDLANNNAHISAAVPAFLGLTADIIVIGADTYTKISLAGDKYEKSTTTPGDPTDPATAIKEVADFLDKPEVAPIKKDDASCGSRSCYQVVISLSADDLKTLLPDQDVGDATVVATILVKKDTLNPASATVTITGTTVGDITVTVVMSDWNKSLTITAPPADQVG